MANLSELPNIGKVLEQDLIKAGIKTPGELKDVGSKEAFLRIWENDSSVCLSELYALEGAVQGIRWHGLDEAKKIELKSFINPYRKSDDAYSHRRFFISREIVILIVVLQRKRKVDGKQLIHYVCHDQLFPRVQ